MKIVYFILFCCKARQSIKILLFGKPFYGAHKRKFLPIQRMAFNWMCLLLRWNSIALLIFCFCFSQLTLKYMFAVYSCHLHNECVCACVSASETQLSRQMVYSSGGCRLQLAPVAHSHTTQRIKPTNRVIFPWALSWIDRLLCMARHTPVHSRGFLHSLRVFQCNRNTVCVFNLFDSAHCTQFKFYGATNRSIITS